MEHDDFTSIFIKCLKQFMTGAESRYKEIGLKFMAEFVSTFQAEDMHPLFDSIIQWNLKVSLSLNLNFFY